MAIRISSVVKGPELAVQDRRQGRFWITGIRACVLRAETPYEIPFPPIIGDKQHQIGREAGRDVIGDIVD